MYRITRDGHFVDQGFDSFEEAVQSVLDHDCDPEDYDYDEVDDFDAGYCEA